MFQTTFFINFYFISIIKCSNTIHWKTIWFWKGKNKGFKDTSRLISIDTINHLNLFSISIPQVYDYTWTIYKECNNWLTFILVYICIYTTYYFVSVYIIENKNKTIHQSKHIQININKIEKQFLFCTSKKKMLQKHRL